MPGKGNSDQEGRVVYYQTQHPTETPRDGRRARGGRHPRPEPLPESRPARPSRRQPENYPGDDQEQPSEGRTRDSAHASAERSADGFTERCTGDFSGICTDDSTEPRSKHQTDYGHDHYPEHHPDHCPDHCKAPSPECIRRRLMESIALEELSIAHLINAEAEKTQAVAHRPLGPVTADELVEVDRSVAKVLEMIVAKEQLLLKKLRLLLTQEWSPDPCDPDQVWGRHRRQDPHWDSDDHLSGECDYDEDGDCE